MTTLSSRRGPSLQRAVRGLVAGLFGILWTLFAWHITAELHVPYVGVVFPLIGVLITLTAWSQAAYHFVHLAGQQRFAEYDFVSLEDQPVLTPKATKTCLKCRADLQPTFHYCPMCGTKV